MEICGVDPLHCKRHKEFIRRNNWSHIKGDAYHLKLLNIYVRHLEQQTNSPKPKPG